MRRGRDTEGDVTEGPSYLAFDVHVSERCLLGHLKDIASFACENSGVVILLQQKRLAAMRRDKLKTVALNVLVEELRLAACECKLFGEEFTAYVGFVAANGQPCTPSWTRV